jgi:hypothetical protein
VFYILFLTSELFENGNCLEINLCLSPNVTEVIKSRWMNKAYSTQLEDNMKFQNMGPLGRLTCILEDNMEMEFREIWYEVRIRLNQLRIRQIRDFYWDFN